MVAVAEVSETEVSIPDVDSTARDPIGWRASTQEVSMNKLTRLGHEAPRWTRLAAVIAALALVVACIPGPKSSRGFRLPDGDAAEGRIVFGKLYCNSCHSVVGEDFPKSPIPSSLDVVLGGQTPRVKTYGQLVTSIINPSHRIGPQQDVVLADGRSMMPTYNETLTVQELIDLVAFLQEHYEVVPPSYEYSTYTY